MNTNKLFYYIFIILRIVLLAVSITMMAAAAFFAVLYFFIPRNYDWYLAITSNTFFKSVFMGTFQGFLKFDSAVFFAGFFSYLVSVFFLRFAFSFRSES